MFRIRTARLLEQLYIRTRDDNFRRCAAILRCEPVPAGPKEKDDRVALFHIARLVHTGECDDKAAVAKVAQEIRGQSIGAKKTRLAGKFKKRRPFYMMLAEYRGNKIPLGPPYD